MSFGGCFWALGFCVDWHNKTCFGKTATTAKVKIGPLWSKIKKVGQKRCSCEPKKFLFRKMWPLDLSGWPKNPKYTVWSFVYVLKFSMIFLHVNSRNVLVFVFLFYTQDGVRCPGICKDFYCPPNYRYCSCLISKRIEPAPKCCRSEFCDCIPFLGKNLIRP